MAGEPDPDDGGVVRPIRWDKLRTDEAEREVRRRVAAGALIFTDHAYQRIAERGAARLNDADVLNILREGAVRQPPRKEPNGWSVTVERRMPGSRDAGVVAVILHPGDDLVVVTVEWMDWRLG